MIHAMIDLETFGTNAHAPIASLGACAVDLTAGKIITPYYYGTADLSSNLKFERVIDGDTVMWWLRQEEAARAALFKNPVELPVLLRGFANWLAVHGNYADIRVWGNGSDFDNVILGNAYKACGMLPPWKYSNNRCFRTLRALAQARGVPKPQRVGTHHNALDDALYQAQGLIDASKVMEIA